MKYYILEGTFIENHPTGDELKKVMGEHFAYLKVGLENGSVSLSGPKTGGDGGIVIVKSDNIEDFCNEDPFVRQGVQKYRVLEFSPNEYLDCLKEWAKQ